MSTSLMVADSIWNDIESTRSVTDDHLSTSIAFYFWEKFRACSEGSGSKRSQTNLRSTQRAFHFSGHWRVKEEGGVFVLPRALLCLLFFLLRRCEQRGTTLCENSLN
ncbi:unnamed protein product [Cuscuta epithymum]|uniref:Uncharacterized protein n=1 Tax=Cuscuta epithymum TaxID=186058 RepID=A0AAV0ER62_9ASTE|nr:unnamed protein product [Cuscuta epithymum]